MKRKLLLSVMMILLVSCVTTGNVQLTQDEVALWMNNTYNAQVRDYKSYFVFDPTTGKYVIDPATGKSMFKPGVSEEQKEILRKKKKIFDQAYPLLKTYSSYVITGKTEPGVVIDQVEQQATALIKELLIIDRGTQLESP